MPIELTCSECQRNLRVQDSVAGKRIKCPSCQAILRVPGGNGESASKPTDSWHLKTPDGSVYGPVRRLELDQWLQEGRVDANCQILAEGNRSWQWASEVYPHLAPKPSLPSEPNPFDFASAPTPPATHYPTGPPHPSSHHAASSYSHHPSYGGREELSDKSKIVAGLLGLFLGPYGVHRFYLGYPGIGIAMLLTLGGCGIWSLIDTIMVFTGAVRDPQGRPLRD